MAGFGYCDGNMVRSHSALVAQVLFSIALPGLPSSLGARLARVGLIILIILAFLVMNESSTLSLTGCCASRLNAAYVNWPMFLRTTGPCVKIANHRLTLVGQLNSHGESFQM